MNATTSGLVVATFVACVVETVEAVTIVMAMGFTRSWRSAWAGVATALVALAAVTAVFGYTLTTWLPESAIQLLIGGLLLIFGLQWLRKAILRAAGRKAKHDEERIFREQEELARQATRGTGAIDLFAFVVSLKGTFLEGMEVVFIVITFGLNARDVPVAAYAAVAAVVVVVLVAFSARRPLSMIPENTLKYGVGLMLASFGTFWSIEGLGIVRRGGASVEWPGGDLAILALIAVWFVLTRVFIAALRPGSRPTPTTGRLLEEVVE
jgi:uncharacterized membrane protein